MAHKVIGEGYMKIPNGEGTYSDIHSWHTPTMPMTVISPGEVMYRQDTSNFTAEIVVVMML
eukprot:6598625-Ditylum_brightwellii.AAC.1